MAKASWSMILFADSLMTALFARSLRSADKEKTRPSKDTWKERPNIRIQPSGVHDAQNRGYVSRGRFASRLRVLELRPDIIALGYDQDFDEGILEKDLRDRGLCVKVKRVSQCSEDLTGTRKIIQKVIDNFERAEKTGET